AGDAVHAAPRLPVHRLRRPETPCAQAPVPVSQVRGAGRLNLAALRSAVRAAIVIPAVFALTDKVIAQPQVSLLAAFGSFAIVVFTEFAGTWRARLLAYASLGAVGALYITLGTLCSRTPWIGAVVMAAVGFATLFSGVLGGYFAAGATGAILTFVLPLTIPAANSVIPQRLAGWGIAVGAGICAVIRRLPDVPDIDSLEQPFRIRVATYSARQIGAYALLASGSDVPEIDVDELVQPGAARTALESAEQIVVEHASVGSVWFQNAV